MIVCAWDGTTYLLDDSRNVVKFEFEDNVCAFCAGNLIIITLIYHSVFCPSYLEWWVIIPYQYGQKNTGLVHLLGIPSSHKSVYQLSIKC